MLTGTDRCDRCGAQACFVAFFEVSELMFCRHHGRLFLAKLQDSALEVFDLSEPTLVPKP